MREILFRAWSEEAKCYRLNVGIDNGRPERNGFQWFNPSNDVYDSQPEQFTGASDRGKKLFEHDRVLVDGDITGVVIYESGAFIIATNDVSDGYVLLSDYVDSEGVFYGEILGNIHDKEQANVL